MAKIEEILAKMQNNPSGIRYHDLCKVCDNFLVKHVKSAVATVFTGRFGLVIQGSISKIKKGWRKFIKFVKF